MLELRIDGGRSSFAPRETLAGQVNWLLDTAPDAVEIRLVWHTEGRGDRDVGLARTVRIEAPTAVGSGTFELVWPSGPYSCSGRLLSIAWALEAVALPGSETARLDLVMGPAGAEVHLGADAAAGG